MNFAIVGTNFISDNFAKAVKLTGNTVYAVYSRKEETGIAFNEKWGELKVYTDFEAMLDDENIHCVYVASPNICHYRQSKMVLSKKKHLLIEKPATLSCDEFRQLMAMAKENDVAMIEAMRCHFVPAYDKIQKAMKSIGTIRRGVFSYCQYSSRYDKFKAGIIENAFKKELGNGSLADIGVYPIAVMTMLFGRPNKIQSAVKILEASIDIYGSILASYENSLVTINYSKVNDSYHSSEIQGENGTIIFSPIAVPKEFTIKRKGQADEVIVCDEREIDMTYEVEGLIKCSQNINLSQNYNEMTLLALEVMDEVKKQNNFDILGEKKRD